MNTLTPGTRCECLNAKHPNRSGHIATGLAVSMACSADAVRMVTVLRRKPVEMQPWESLDPPSERIPMCEACASFHEKGGNRA